MTASAAPPGAQFNFAQHLIALNQQRAAKVAFIDDQGNLSYGDLALRIRSTAAALLALGIRREERVLVLMHDCNDWPVAFLGAMYAGIVPVAVNTLLTAEDYAYMLQHSRAQAALVSNALLPALQAAMAQGGHEVKSVIVSRPTAALPAGMLAMDRAHQPGRPWLLAVFLRLHRQAQRHPAQPR
jgi:benzoate-CoA ligase